MPDLAGLFPGYESRWIETSGGAFSPVSAMAAGRRFSFFTAIRKAT